MLLRHSTLLANWSTVGQKSWPEKLFIRTRAERRNWTELNSSIGPFSSVQLCRSVRALTYLISGARAMFIGKYFWCTVLLMIHFW